ncbi:MAG: M20/M25/M40 family metallo-hydrolase [Anaerolineales bacterium]
MKPLIARLADAYGPSGKEDSLRQIVRSELKGLSDYISEDPLGNVHAVIKQKTRAGRKIMVSAPMDEVGLIVSHVDDHGFARFSPLGDVDLLQCPGARVRFGDGRMGVIGMADRARGSARRSWSELFIDVGASDRENHPLQVGDTAVFASPLEEAGAALIGKGLNGRIGVAILIETLRRLKRSPHEVQFVFTVQEQVGQRGARTAAFRLEPEIAISVSAIPSGDTPGAPHLAVGLGKGPAIKVRDASLLCDPRVVRWMVQRAEEARLPYQLEVSDEGATGAAEIQRSRAGVIVGSLGIPCRYLHGPAEMADLNDAENAVKLLTQLLALPVPF